MAKETFHTEYTIKQNGDNYNSVIAYMSYRNKQLKKFGFKRTMERYIHDDGCVITYYESPIGDWQSLYLLSSQRGKGNYLKYIKKYGLKIVTFPECKLEEYLKSKNIEHIVLKHSPGYKLVQRHYGNKTAKRSQVPYIYHIDEGLTILNMLGANYVTKEAFCLHPILQNDEDFVENKNMDFTEIQTESLLLAMEYRRVANSYLSTSHPSQFVGFPCEEVKQMLIADKVQNYKDFIRYQDNLTNQTELLEYFEYWFKLLNVDPDDFIMNIIDRN